MRAQLKPDFLGILKGIGAGALFCEKWFEDHHFPNEDASEETRSAYNRELLAQTNNWIRERPNSTYFWEIRLDAVTQLKGVSPQEIETAADQLIQAAKKNSGPVGPDSSDYFKVAYALSKWNQFDSLTTVSDIAISRQPQCFRLADHPCLLGKPRADVTRCKLR